MTLPKSMPARLAATPADKRAAKQAAALKRNMARRKQGSVDKTAIAPTVPSERLAGTHE